MSPAPRYAHVDLRGPCDALVDVGDWIVSCAEPVVWVSGEEGLSDPLAYCDFHARERVEGFPDSASSSSPLAATASTAGGGEDGASGRSHGGTAPPIAPARAAEEARLRPRPVALPAPTTQNEGAR